MEHYGLERMVASRFHLIAWRGWTEPARWLGEQGFSYDLDYMTTISRHIPTLGYMTGGSLPLRFYTEAGEPLSVRQLATQLDDHPNPRLPFGPQIIGGKPPKLSREDYLGVAHTLVRLSAERFHSPVVLNNHPLQFFFDPDWLTSIIGVAQESGMVVWSVADYDRFIEGLRHSQLTRAPGEARWRVTVHHPTQDVLVLNAPALVDVWVDGEARKVRRERRWRRPVAVVTLSRGEHTVALLPPTGAGG